MSVPVPGAAASLWRVRVVAAGAVALYAGVLLARFLPAGLIVAVDNLGQLLAATSAAGCCALASLRSAPGRPRSSWALLAGGVAAWAAGQAVWSYYELAAAREVPFPSLADAGFLTFPVLAAGGLLLLPSGRDATANRLRDLLDGLVTAGSFLILSWASSLGAAASGGITTFTTALAVAYPLGDVVLLTLVLLVLARAATADRAVLTPLAVGLSALAIADSTFLHLTTNGSYSTGNLCGIGWTAGFALIAVAALTTARRSDVPLAEPFPTEALVRGGVKTARLRLALPYLPLLPAQAVVTAQLLTGDRRAPAFEVALALSLVVLVLARQFWTLADNRELLLALRAEREAARHAALHDPLTGLANRTLFRERVDRALATQASQPAITTVLFCDLDDFKTVNDRLGHAAGDDLLVDVAERLRDCLRPADTVARLGGDEFAALIQSDLSSTGHPEQIAGRLVAALAVPFSLPGCMRVSVSVSVGLASCGRAGDAELVAAELLHRADVAMYAAKASGKAAWASYDPQQDTTRNQVRSSTARGETFGRRIALKGPA